jgi:hypothetical protein
MPIGTEIDGLTLVEEEMYDHYDNQLEYRMVFRTTEGKYYTTVYDEQDHFIYEGDMVECNRVVPVKTEVITYFILGHDEDEDDYIIEVNGNVIHIDGYELLCMESNDENEIPYIDEL